LRVALTPKRAEEFRLLKKVADEAGLETALIDAAEAKQRFPLMEFGAATAILWCPYGRLHDSTQGRQSLSTRCEN